MERDSQGQPFWGWPSFVILLVLNLTLLFLTQRGILSLERTITLNLPTLFYEKVIRPMESVGNYVGVRNYVAELEGENQRLQKEIQTLRQVGKGYEELLRENTLLREQLEFSQTLRVNHLVAEIIAKDPGNIFASLLIDKGTDQGVQVGAPVVAPYRQQLALVGKVVKVSSRSAQIIPLFSDTFHIASRFQKSRFEGLISGTGQRGSLLVMNYVPKTALPEIQERDTIISSGGDSRYPEGIYIGSMGKVTSKDYSTSLEIEVLPYINFEKLEYLFVLIEEEEDL